MRKLFLLTIFSILLVFNIYSQVAIGPESREPNINAVLDLQSTDKGFLLPRVELVGTDKAAPMTNHVAGMKVYNTATVDSGITSVSPGLYYNDGTRWIRLVAQNTIYFYAPTMVVPTETDDPNYNPTTKDFNLDLYAIYKAQFSLADKTSSVKNLSAGELPILEKDQLDYFVTYYDNEVFTSLSISNSGVLTYKLKNDFEVTSNTFINVVFKVK